MTARLVATAVLAAALAACGTKADDPFTADIKMICHAGPRDPGMPADMQRAMAFREIAEKIKTPEAARLMAQVIQVAPAEKAALMADALKKAGLSRCPLIE